MKRYLLASILVVVVGCARSPAPEPKPDEIAKDVTPRREASDQRRALVRPPAEDVPEVPEVPAEKAPTAGPKEPEKKPSSSSLARAATYYVSPRGNDDGPGTKEAPFRTMGHAASRLKGGDTLYLRGGSYGETLRLDRKDASMEDPILIASAPGEQAVLDGTVDIHSIADGAWQRHKGSTYRIRIRKDIWQLIIDGQDMVRARWPNASLDPESSNYLWGGRSGDSYVSPELGTAYGKIVDSKLKEFPYSLSGAMAVINQRYRTFSRLVKEHEPKGDTFLYDRDVDQRHLPANERSPKKVPTETAHYTERSCLHMRYYLEGKLEFLDHPGEWFYDKASGMLYVHTLDGKSPNGKQVRGKVKDHGLEVIDSRGIVIDGIDFFGCAFRLDKVTECEVRNCNLSYYSALRRMLGEEVPQIIRGYRELFVPIQVVGKGGAGTKLENGKAVHKGRIADQRIAIRNCRFEYGEGTALFTKANGITVENCRFSHIDWSCCGKGPVAGDGFRKTYRRLEFEWCLNSETLSPNATSFIELCDFGRELGTGQEDGANIEMTSHFGNTVRYCWFHDNKKFGPRFDGFDTRPERRGGRIHHNVCFNMNSINPDLKIVKGAETIKSKGDQHWIVNNTLLNIAGVGIGVPARWPDEKKGPQFWKIFEREGHEVAKLNSMTVTRNNICRLIASTRVVKDAEAGKYPPAGIADHNIHEDASRYLRDPANRDFRPKAGGKMVGAGVYVEGITPPELKNGPVDIGAYQHGCTNYWIPGFQEARASKPIPANGATNAKPDTDLIWLGGYQGTAHEIYLGIDREAVAKADTNSPLFRGRQGNNIYTPKRMPVGRACYWRVDTVKDGSTVTGDVWRFEFARSIR